MACVKTDFHVTDVVNGILDSKHAQPLAQNAINVDAKTILPRCAAQNHDPFMAYS